MCNRHGNKWETIEIKFTGEILQGKEEHRNYKCTHRHPIEILGMTNSITFII